MFGRKAWIKIGCWMDKEEEEVPTIIRLSSNEENLIKYILYFTKEKRIELMKEEWRIIKIDDVNYSWSDLLIFPDVLEKVEKNSGWDEDAIISFSSRLRPVHSTIGMRYLLSKQNKKTQDALIHMGLSTLESSLVQESIANKNKSRKGGLSSPFGELEEVFEKFWLELKAENNSFSKSYFAGIAIKRYGKSYEDGSSKPSIRTVTESWIPKWIKKYEEK